MLSTTTGVVLLAVILLLTVTNIAVPTILMFLCKLHIRRVQASAMREPSAMKPCAAYGLVGSLDTSQGRTPPQGKTLSLGRIPPQEGKTNSYADPGYEIVGTALK